jgi:tetrapyrrole methylase family protein/MazG family protein
MQSKTPDISPLFRIMATLRSPEGCPWDREQTHQSLRPFLLEETYETLEAIDEVEEGDDQGLCEELGDLLLQIVFHAQLADERGAFDLEDVIVGIVEKMRRRHPHVFGDESIDNADAVHERWNAIKKNEGKTLFGGVPRSLPALMRAQKVSEIASLEGFDWSEIEPVIDKLKEETGEIERAIFENDGVVGDELGDILFCAVNMARHLNLNAEDVLQNATLRFQGRFLEMMREFDDSGQLSDCSVEALEEMWQAAKRRLAK